MGSAEQLGFIDASERQALCSPSTPIVLLRRRGDAPVADLVAPDNSLLGVMLPASPLHHLLCRAFNAPLVATSGNRQNETICIDDQQALDKLGDIADCFLTHNRPILRPLDDSIVRLLGDKITVLRRARGYTPLPITISRPLPDALATGSYFKNTVAIARDRHIIVSQHHGDLNAAETQQQFADSIADLRQFYRFEPTLICHDLHPDYSSSQFARRQTQAKLPLQHHHAHILACMAEHDLAPPVLGFAWDGAGLGSDHGIWGGEVLTVTHQGFHRYAHLRRFPLMGGDQAAKEPKRLALGLLHAMLGDDAFLRTDLAPLSAFTESQLSLLKQILNKRINCPQTSSMGRLFDAVASLLDLCQENEFEGQAAMRLEQAASNSTVTTSYPFELSAHKPIEIDWRPMMRQIIRELGEQNPEDIAARFHNTLADIAVAIAQTAGQIKLVLSGGCFQNALLIDGTIKKLKKAGFQTYTHEKIPPNDGGLAVGQAYATAWLRPA
nr:carbamoyltransferase HypF [Methylomarinum sp. Ch1-1]MDP4519292.1 carbamoyltransferase HypF [Methylomarinum sp. Ch1-1]